MPIPNIGRQVGQINVSAAYQAKIDDTLIVCDATSAGFTVTLYKDLDSGAYHRLVVKVSDDDESGNTVTITDGTFSTTLASTSASVELETDYEGNWLAVASFPTQDANTAISAADSAGLAASEAESAAGSAGLGSSSANSAAASLVITDSTTRSIAASATLSGVSNAISTATSQNTAQSGVISQNLSTALSAAESA